MSINTTLLWRPLLWSLLHPAAQKKGDAPDLSREKRMKQERPLDFLVQAAAIDPATKWRRVFQLGR